MGKMSIEQKYNELKEWMRILLIPTSVIFATFRLGEYAYEIKSKISVYDGYAISIAKTDSSIKKHEEADNYMHIYFMKQIDSLKNIIISEN